MATLLLQITALLVAVTGTFASEYPCKVSTNTVTKYTLDCSNRDLTAPPAGVWTSFGTLYLVNNPITAFAKNAFTGFPDMVNLSIRNTSLTEIDLGDFVVMTKLQTLAFVKSNIKTIIPAPEGTSFPLLFHFNVQSNFITTLDPDFLSNAPIMNHMTLSDNPLVVKNGEPVFNHNKLQSIYVGQGSNFADQNIDALLSGVPNLIFVGLAESHLTNVTGAFVNLKILATVQLENNSISQITANTFSSEGVLKTLSLVGNPLTRLDTAAVNTAMKRKGRIDFTDTPLACNCLYEGLFWWAVSKEITLDAKCGGVNLSDFTRR